MRPAKHIGILGVSAEGAALCYTTICVESNELLGKHVHPEVSMHTYPFHLHVELMAKDDFDGVADLLLESSKKLAKIGADFLICPDNTAHTALDKVRAELPLPLVHISEVVADVAATKGVKRTLVLGTRHLMESQVYAAALASKNISFEVPMPADRQRVDEIIFDELVMSRFEDSSRDYIGELMRNSKDRGCDAVVLGCTELPILIEQSDSILPILDSTRLLARAAIQEAVATE